jgi:hypothetical protein
MPLVATRGAASAQGFGEFAQQTAPVYIEDVFSTYLYTGNNTGANQAQTITNGMDLAGKGGLVWLKKRSGIDGSSDNALQSSTGGNPLLISNATNPGQSGPIYSFNASGFTLWLGSSQSWNWNAIPYTSWTFRKQSKFFDVVNYTGDGSTNRSISHSLNSTPGCIIIKSLSNDSVWVVWHRGNTTYGTSPWFNFKLNTADKGNESLGIETTPTSSVFYVSADPPFNSKQTNISGQNYVAYLFAHNAGGFGLTGTDNVITCSSVTNSGGSQYIDVNLGYEPQWLLVKNADGTSTAYWQIVDNMRGLTNNPVATAVCRTLSPNTNGDEFNPGNLQITATGFRFYGTSYGLGDNLIYIAIRRGPMKTPTTGTSVFVPIARTGTGTVGAETSVGFASDWMLNKVRPSPGNSWPAIDRLRGNPLVLIPNNTNAELNLTSFGNPATNGFTGPSQNSYYWPADGGNYNGATTYASYFFRRAAGFFDIVCYSGTGSATTFNHNLGVVPEMMIVKRRSSSGSDWWVYNANLGNTRSLRFTNESAFTLLNIWNNTSPTSSVFTIGADSAVNGSGSTYVNYLFASCPGVSKVGSYTGTGALQTINCGFTGGARFVLIKRTDSTGDWFVYDSARGISSGDDPYLLLNTTDAEVTGTNYVATTSVGFQVTAAAPAELNAAGGTYIFLAIA